MLNQQQQQAADKARSELLAGREYLVSGGAGTGKSFTAAEIFIGSEEIKKNYQLIFCAPTNKATKVLEYFVHNSGLDTDNCLITTVHSYLKLSPRIDKETGVRRFEPRKSSIRDIEPKKQKPSIVICDEAGCLEEDLIYYLFKKPEPKLFLGDRCQLSPVGERESYIFDLMSDSMTELTEVVRYTGHILESATYIRKHIDSYRLNFPKDNDGEEGIFILSNLHREKRIAELVKDDEFLHNRNFFKVGTWRNDAMDYWNMFIRNILYPEQTQPWFSGLRIVALDACSDKRKVRYGEKEYWKTQKLVSASMEADVVEVTLGRADYGAYFSQTHGGYPPAFATWYLDCINEFGEEVTLRVIDNNDKQKLVDYLELLARESKWKLFYDVKDYFHNIGDAYSMTVRRLQGSTLKNIVIDKADVNACPRTWEKNRIWYVLITRAQQRVYL